MTRPPIAGLTLAFMILLLASTSTNSSRALTLEDCSCLAPDRSCLASISCRRGYIQHWAGQGDCYAEPSGFYVMFGMETTLKRINREHYPAKATMMASPGKALNPSEP